MIVNRNNPTYAEFREQFQFEATKKYRLGKGGYSVVYKAWDSRHRKWVSIKIAEADIEKEHLSLKRETELVDKKLPPGHPNIVYYEKCYRFTIPQTGVFDYAVLNYYEEGNLLKLKNKESLSLNQKQFILEQLLEGIRFLHENKIIHRDLKPENILISFEGGKYIPKISDFGISKDTETDQASFTNSLKIASKRYASPEQLDDENNSIDYNTDLWSFGIIALGLFLDALPFDKETLDKIKQGILPSIDFLPEAWQMLIKGCLKANPDDRIQNCEECQRILSENREENFPSEEQLELKPKKNGKESNTQPIESKRKWMYAIVGCLIVFLFAYSYINFDQESSQNAYKEAYEKAKELAEQEQAVKNNDHLIKNYIDYIKMYKELAISEGHKYKIPASIILGNALIESNAGQATLAKEANNHFSMKCHSDWTGERVYRKDDLPKECFRKYKSVRDSYDDYCLMLVNLQQYSNLRFTFNRNDYKAWIDGLFSAGYGGDSFKIKLKKVIEDYQLYLLSQ